MRNELLRRLLLPITILASTAVSMVWSTATVSAGTSSTCARPYSADSPWNTPIGPSPAIAARSAAHIGAIEGELSSDPTQYTYPVYEVGASTPRRPVSVAGWFSNVTDGGARLVNQRGGSVDLAIPDGAVPASGTDAQIVLVDPVSGDEWGASRFQRAADGSLTASNVYHYHTAWSGVPPTSDAGGVFANRGSGIPYLAGLVRPCEIAQGRIDHALAFAYDSPTASFVYPATKSDGASGDPDDLPEGSRLQLDPSLGRAAIEAWGCTGPCFVIARALQEYGMIVVDNSGRPKVMLEYQGTAGWSGVDANTARPIPISAFRVLAPGSATGTPGGGGSVPPSSPPPSPPTAQLPGDGAPRSAGSGLRLLAHRIGTERARVGARLPAVITVLREDAAATDVRLRCRATILGKPVRLVRSNLTRTGPVGELRGTCHWRLPRGSAGRMLRALAEIRSATGSAGVEFGVRVRPPRASAP